MPRREYERRWYKPCFETNLNPGLRFISAFTSYEPTLGGSVQDQILDVMIDLISRDQVLVLAYMHDDMDAIDLSLSNSQTLRRLNSTWRDQLGRWRKALFHYGTTRKYLNQAVEYQIENSHVQGNGKGTNPSRSKIEDLKEELEITRVRMESMFQALMSTMSIVESERAIQEAEAISKLTNLAFFFIPWTLVAGVFGMNVIVSLLVDYLDAAFTKSLSYQGV